MSTSATPVNLSWKQEVNRRVAAHLNRKSPLVMEHETARENRPNPGNRAAQAAARVAARYAKAPSYSEMLANEARATILAAEAASRAAQEMQAAAQSVLDSLEAAASDERMSASGLELASDRREEVAEQQAYLELEPEQAPIAHPVEPHENPSYAVRWEPELPRYTAAPTRHTAGFEDWRDAEATIQPTYQDAQEYGVVEPAQPIFANLIEFPRELVATRKVRPRLVEGPLAAEEPGAQLSIFEVDPGAISMEPEVAIAATVAPAPAWNGPEWSGIRLDEQPEGELVDDVQQAAPKPAIEQAPASRRLLAAAVDFALVSGAVFGTAYWAAARAAVLPGVRAVELGSALALLAGWALYHAFFLSVAKFTPGMKYAQIRLTTLDGQTPTRAQRNARFGALLLSVLPVGLGVVWAVFDEDRLTWHDRLSRTYLRRD